MASVPGEASAPGEVGAGAAGADPPTARPVSGSRLTSLSPVRAAMGVYGLLFSPSDAVWALAPGEGGEGSTAADPTTAFPRCRVSSSTAPSPASVVSSASALPSFTSCAVWAASPSDASAGSAEADPWTALPLSCCSMLTSSSAVKVSSARGLHSFTSGAGSGATAPGAAGAGSAQVDPSTAPPLSWVSRFTSSSPVRVMAKPHAQRSWEG
jgi:hypothetical protein